MQKLPALLKTCTENQKGSDTINCELCFRNSKQYKRENLKQKIEQNCQKTWLLKLTQDQPHVGLKKWWLYQRKE